MRRPRVLFVAPARSSFVRDDLALLREHYDVSEFTFGVGRAAALARGLARQARWLHAEGARPAGERADLVYGWFADYPLALPVRWARRRGVPVVVAVGGYDAACLPELDYGVFCSRWRAPLARGVLRGASLLLPVAQALVESENAFAPGAPTRQGVRAHVPGLVTPVAVLPTGYDAAAWPAGPAVREPRVVTAALVATERTWHLKGLDLLADAARRLPGVAFEVVGVAPALAASKRPHVPPNVTLGPPVPRHALAAVYARAAVVAHLSRSEGLPNALCEAMLCGCVPVVSRVGGMPEAAGDTGRIVDAPDADAIADALVQALAQPDRAAPRARIATQFSRERRRAGLAEHLDRLIAGGPAAG